MHIVLGHPQCLSAVTPNIYDKVIYDVDVLNEGLRLTLGSTPFPSPRSRGKLLIDVTPIRPEQF